MSGRIYDSGIDPVCGKCGSKMLSSAERNFNGPKCKNKKCDGSLMDAIYKNNIFIDSEKQTPVKVEYDKDGKIILHGILQRFSQRFY